MKFWDASAIIPLCLDEPRTTRLRKITEEKAADSLQLAAALVWANGHPTSHSFVCLDEKLRDAAHREGFKVLPA